MNKSNVGVLALLILLLLTMGCKTEPAQTQSLAEPSTDQVQVDSFLPNYLIEAEGSIVLRRPGWAGFYPIDFGTSLTPGDLVMISDGGRAAVFCGDTALWQEGSLMIQADNLEHGIPCQSGMPPRPWPDVAALRGAESDQIPYIIYPHNTALLSATPALRWNPLAGVERYTLSILSDDGQERAPAVVNTDRIAWPSQWPPLELRATYVLIVAADEKVSDQGNETHSGLGFWLLAGEEAETVYARADQLAGLNLSEAARKLLIAELYMNHQLRAEAILLLEEISQSNNGSAIWLTLGKAYLENDLWREARQAFENALQISRQKGEIETQALAYFGLGLAERSHAQTGTAQEHFQAALGLFNQIGDQSQAADVSRYIEP